MWGSYTEAKCCCRRCQRHPSRRRRRSQRTEPKRRIFSRGCHVLRVTSASVWFSATPRPSPSLSCSQTQPSTRAEARLFSTSRILRRSADMSLFSGWFRRVSPVIRPTWTRLPQHLTLGHPIQNNSEDYEQVLASLANDIQKRQSRLAEIHLRERRWTLLGTIYTLSVWVAYVSLWYINVLPSFSNRPRFERSLKGIPVFIGPIM